TRRGHRSAMSLPRSHTGWERENRAQSVGVSNRVGSCERPLWLFPLPSDGSMCLEPGLARAHPFTRPAGSETKGIAAATALPAYWHGPPARADPATDTRARRRRDAR